MISSTHSGDTKAQRERSPRNSTGTLGGVLQTKVHLQSTTLEHACRVPCTPKLALFLQQLHSVSLDDKLQANTARKENPGYISMTQNSFPNHHLVSHWVKADAEVARDPAILLPSPAFGKGVDKLVSSPQQTAQRLFLRLTRVCPQGWVPWWTTAQNPGSSSHSALERVACLVFQPCLHIPRTKTPRWLFTILSKKVLLVAEFTVRMRALSVFPAVQKESHGLKGSKNSLLQWCLRTGLHTSLAGSYGFLYFWLRGMAIVMATAIPPLYIVLSITLPCPGNLKVTSISRVTDLIHRLQPQKLSHTWWPTFQMQEKGSGESASGIMYDLGSL